MKPKFYHVLFFVLMILIPVITVYPQLKKGIKTLRPAVQKKMNAEQPENITNIAKKLQEFIHQNGIKTFQKKSSASSNSVQSKLNNKKISPYSKSNLKNENIIYDKETGMPLFIRVTSSLAKSNTAVSQSDFVANGKAFLVKEKEVLRINDPSSELVMKKEFEDNLGITHLRFTQEYKGLEVWAKELILHMNLNGTVSSMSGRFIPSPSVIKDVNAKVSSNEAINISLNKSGIGTDKMSQQIKELLKYNGPSVQKIIWCDENMFPHLAWFVEVRKGLSQDWYYFIDANTGTVLNHYNNVCFDGGATGSGTDLNGDNRSFGTYLSGSTYYMMDITQPMFDAANSKLPDYPKGAIVTLDLRNNDLTTDNPLYYVTSSSNSWTDPATISAHFNAITTYNYYHTVFNRNSIDDKGMTILSVVHATKNSQSMENAYWAGTLMCYGDGGTYFKPLAGGLDVAAHEMTHGVTQHTANLEYQDQSGALNESMSDVFGAMVDDKNWTMGEDVIKDFNTFPSGALRDLANPHNGGTEGSSAWQPANMSEFVTTNNDNGGVHINSGIPNHAFYLAATALGRSVAANIWYRALTVYLTRSSKFIDARIATVNAATDLYGASSTQVTEVKNAWDGVGVTDGSGTQPPPPSTITGDNWILMKNTDPNDPNSIYMAKTQIQSSSDFYPLSQTSILTKPAVSDGSGIIIFVDQDYNLRALNADPNNPAEEVLDNSGVWWSVSIGPGLSSLALTSRYIDSTIYYLDLINQVEKKFKIKTQSYDAPDGANTALYADALSFDPSGQYLLFDAYNEIHNASNDTISFWTIDMLDVSSGTMGNVFAPLPEGINVGDPSFSKTSQIHFTFDYWDNNSQSAYIEAADFNTGNSGIVAGPLSLLGYPTYSGDDKIIAFHTIDKDQQGASHEAVMQVALKDNMIEAAGDPQSYVIEATYPVWFVIGTRTTDTKDEQNNIPISFNLSQNYPNPFNPATSIEFQIINSDLVTLKVYNVLGDEVAVIVNKELTPGIYRYRWDAAGMASGVYFYKLSTSNYTAVKKMILMK